MKTTLKFSAIIALVLPMVLQAQNLPLILSNSELLSIRDGDVFHEKAWTVVPEANPDIYATNSLGQDVTFITDIDSIRFSIAPDTLYNFIVLLNGRDSAFTQIKYVKPHLEILKESNDYSPGPGPIINFSYQPSSDQYLRDLKVRYNLDSVAGNGNEVSRILNVMHWIHGLVPHDGNIENPKTKNALALISTCQIENRGLNCRGLATALNECYLSLGIPSRFVTCMPKDSVFDDCHVINSVYSHDLKKWLWMAPTHDAYIMDETGNLLGIEEVRQRLIDDRPLILNPDANWNRKSTTTIEYYLYEYMAKNLYRIECPLKSVSDLETSRAGKTIEYVELVPLSSDNENTEVQSEKVGSNGVTYRNNKTTFADAFWRMP